MKSKSKKSLLSIFVDILAVIAVIVLLWFIFGSICENYEKQIVEKYIEDEPKIQELYKTIKPLFDDPTRKFTGKLEPLNKIDILKKISMKKGNKSYTINKEVIHMCLKDEHGQYYPLNCLVYVLLHEIAHVINKEIGHGKTFQDINDELLEYASKMGVYDPSIPMIPNYCEYSKDD